MALETPLRTATPVTAVPVAIVRRPLATLALSWASMVGLDFTLHAGVLAPLYDWDSPVLLQPAIAFARIPVGYLGLFVLAVGIAWLLGRLSVTGGREGALVGGAVGAVTSGAFLLGLWSISTVDPGLIAGWWLAATLELGVAGYVTGEILGGARLRGLAGRVVLLILAGVASAVVLQSIGYATAPILAT
jgi:hypothetical protein